MKKFEYVYFTIYHHYSKKSYFPDSATVRLKSMYLLCFSVGGWILFLQALFLRLVKNAWFVSQSTAMFYSLSIFGAITFLFYRVFIINGHDQKIFDKYVNSWPDNPNKKRDLLVASLFIAIPFISMIALRVFLPRQ